METECLLILIGAFIGAVIVTIATIWIYKFKI